MRPSVLVAGCGGGKQEEARESKIACRAAAVAQPPKLPADFPQPGELSYTRSQKAGPTLVVDGYWTADLDEAYREFKGQVEGAGYKILFTEKGGSRRRDLVRGVADQRPDRAPRRLRRERHDPGQIANRPK